MSVSAVGSATQTQLIQTTSPVSKHARAADGDYKTPGRGRSRVKDSDGDYKPVPVSTQSTASPSVQAALAGLKLGG